MKPKERMKQILKLAFRPDDQPGLFTIGGPVVVLLSDVQEHMGGLLDDVAELTKERNGLNREILELRRAGAGGAVKRRNAKHLFPEVLGVQEDERIRATCRKYGASFDPIIAAARLYSEQNAVKYASWPAAIEVALANDYQWLRGARTPQRQAATVGDHVQTDKQKAAQARFRAARDAADARKAAGR